MRNNWLEDRLKALPGKYHGKKKAFAKALGPNVSESRITEIIKGKRKIQPHEIRLAAEFLDVPEGDVLSFVEGSDAYTEGGLVRVTVMGFVQAGLWAEAAELPRDERRTFVVGKPKTTPGPYFGLIVRGPSMNLLWDEGTVLVCAPTGRAGVVITNGNRVIVERRNPQGLVEATCKEVVEKDGQVWLWPRSTEPEYQEPWLAPEPDTEAAGRAEIKITAKVLMACKPELGE